MSFPEKKGDFILVTGGEGFIGKHVRKALSKLGTSVVSVDCRPAGVDRHRQCYDCDIRDRARINEIFASNKVAGVIHLASLLRTASERDPLTATQVNIMGSLNILEAVRAFKVQRVVYASSASVYGTRGAADTAREEDVTAPEDVYGSAKKYVEMLGEAYRRAYGIEFIVLRVPIVVGPGAMDTASPWRSELSAVLTKVADVQYQFHFRKVKRSPLFTLRIWPSNLPASFTPTIPLFLCITPRARPGDYEN